MFENDEYNYDGVIADSEKATETSEKETDAEAADNTVSTVDAEYTDNTVSTENAEKTINMTHVTDTANNRKKNKGGVKFLKFAGMAAAFGLVAGVCFYGVNYIADRSLGTNVVIPQSTTNETVGITVNKTDSSLGKGELAVMDMSAVIESAKPSAVQITGTVTQTYQMSPFFGGNYSSESPVSGTGVIIGQSDSELLIVTNAHVVDDVNNLTVTFTDGTTADAVVKGSKSNKDIAVVAVSVKDISADTLSKISIIDVGNSDELKMGQPVIALGNALGEGQSSTVGWISALDRTITIDGQTYEGLIMTDAAINPGNSGGALLNANGQLIGITSAKYADESVEGMGYAIPISSVADIINNLMNKQTRTKVDEDKIGFLGVAGMDITSSISKSYNWPEGGLITQIGEDSPASRAGILKNDIIATFDGEDITSFEQLRSLMEYYSEGETVTVEYYRLENGEYVLKSTEVTLGNRSQNQTSK